MRYGVTATKVHEWIGMKVLRVPIPVADVLLGPLQARALMAAENAGVFRKLSRGSATASTLAEHLALDAESLRLVLRVLRAMGYVRLSGEKWSLTRDAKRWFGDRATEPYDAYVQYGVPQWKMIEHLDDLLRTGQGIDFHDHQSDRDWKTYQESMFENAQASSWFVVKHLPVPRGAKSLLDIAGSHGWLAAEIARKRRGLRATVFDRAEAIGHARAIARQHRYDDRVTFEEGDLRTGSFGTNRDVVLMSNILHHFTGEENLAILKRVRAAMTPGGSLGIFEIETPAATSAPDAVGDAFALFFRITSNSTAFRGDDYIGWLASAGFSDVKVVRSVRMPSRMLVIARA